MALAQENSAQSLARRLAVALSAALAVLIIGLVWFAVLMWRDNRQKAIDDIVRQTLALRAVAQQAHRAGAQRAEELDQRFRSLIAPVGLEIQTGEDGKPSLQYYGEALEDNFKYVDIMTRQNGALATVFRRDGDDFTRIATSLTLPGGARGRNPLGQGQSRLQRGDAR